MKIPFIQVFIMFIYFVVASAIPVTPSDSHPLARGEQQDHLQILFVSKDVLPTPSGTPADQFDLDIGKIEREYQDRKNLLVPSDALATNRMLLLLQTHLDDDAELDEGWYKNSIQAIASGLDLVSQLEKHPSNDLDLNTRTLITNFLIYMESAIVTVKREQDQETPPPQTTSLKTMLEYLTTKLQIFIEFTKSEPKARLTFEEMGSKLQDVYKNKFKSRNELHEQILNVEDAENRFKSTKSMTWTFRALEIVHLIQQGLQQSAASDRKETHILYTTLDLMTYSQSIRRLISKLGNAGRKDSDGEQWLTKYLKYLEKLDEELEGKLKQTGLKRPLDSPSILEKGPKKQNTPPNGGSSGGPPGESSSLAHGGPKKLQLSPDSR
ncbi:hypothetical protein H0H93_015920 [Arthromyces matolae]|nr:hypothetical protein H0H93_015920 [Arthromyces matolae]